MEDIYKKVNMIHNGVYTNINDGFFKNMKQFSCTESYLRGFNPISCKWYGMWQALPLHLYVPWMLQRKMLTAMHVCRPFSLPAWLGFHFVLLSLRPHLLVPTLSKWRHHIINLSAFGLLMKSEPLWCNHLPTAHQLILKPLSQAFGGCFQVTVQHFLWSSAMLGHS